jgi:hypothetical protein
MQAFSHAFGHGLHIGFQRGSGLCCFFPKLIWVLLLARASSHQEQAKRRSKNVRQCRVSFHVAYDAGCIPGVARLSVRIISGAPAWIIAAVAGRSPVELKGEQLRR